MSGEFEGKSLDALHAMIASARPGDITGAGEALAAAVPKILGIAKDLRSYIDRVRWEGEGAEAFRTWGAGMVSETLVLSDFTKVVSEQMKIAGNALSEAQCMVPKPVGMCFADPEKEKARIEAETGPKLQEAVQQMRRLASYYDTTKDRIGSEKQPEFKSMGYGFGAGEREYGSGGGGTSGNGTHSGAGSGSRETGSTSIPRPPETPSEGVDRSVREQVSVPPSTPARPPQPDTNTNTNLDSTTLLPDAPTRPSAQPPTIHQPPMPPVTTVGPQQVPLPPMAQPVGPPVGPGAGRGLPRTPLPGLPGPSAPRTGLPGGPSPLGPGPRPSEGIVGGRQVPTSQPGLGQRGSRMPMATVIGEEQQRASTPYGRGAGGMHGGGPGMHGAPSGGPGGAGRRLATQPGGTVGTSAASGRVGRTAFTPGGTGLVRPPASHQQGEEPERTSGHRPDYLLEDEETWHAGQRRIVPPVID